MVKNHNFCPNSESIYVILNLALVPGKVFNSRGRDVFFFINSSFRRGATSKKSFGIYLAFHIHSLKFFSNPLVLSRALAMAILIKCT